MGTHSQGEACGAAGAAANVGTSHIYARARTEKEQGGRRVVGAALFRKAALASAPVDQRSV
jgi:hypothetical protein